MAPRTTSKENGQSRPDNIAFIRQMLGELRQVAEREGADMLCYLLEMAYVEAGDLQAGGDTSSIRHGKRY
jgi:hypothetical protein